MTPLAAESDGHALAEAILVSGFLGAGKTSFIAHVLLPWLVRRHRPALLVNDSGDENFDADRLAQAGVPLVSVAGGCGCCAVEGAMAEAVARLARGEHRPVVIEGSGLADPGPILEALRADGIASTVVLAVVHGPTWRERLPLAPVQGQLAFADWVFITAAEEMPPAEIRRLTRAVSEHRARPISFWRRDAGVLDPRWPGVLAALAGAPDRAQPLARRCSGPTPQHAGMASRTLPVRHWATREAWEEWVHALPARVWRVKGMVPVVGAVWPQALDHNGSGPPAWHEPSGPRALYLVVVGEEQSLDALPPLPTAPAPDRWSDPVWHPPGSADGRRDMAWRAGTPTPPASAAQAWCEAISTAGADDLVWLAPSWASPAAPMSPEPPLDRAEWQGLLRQLSAWREQSPHGRWFVAGWPLAFVQALARLAAIPPARIWHGGECWAWPDAALSWLAPSGEVAPLPPAAARAGLEAGNPVSH